MSATKVYDYASYASLPWWVRQETAPDAVKRLRRDLMELMDWMQEYGSLENAISDYTAMLACLRAEVAA